MEAEQRDDRSEEGEGDSGQNSCQRCTRHLRVHRAGGLWAAKGPPPTITEPAVPARLWLGISYAPRDDCVIMARPIRGDCLESASLAQLNMANSRQHQTAIRILGQQSELQAAILGQAKAHCYSSITL